MPRVDFYEVRELPWELVLCRRVEDVYAHGERAYVLATGEAQARSLDDLLWTFRDDSFVPHLLWQGEATLEDPVAVGWRPGNPNGAAWLVLARDAAPEDLAGYERVLDFVPTRDAALTEAARRRFRVFRAAGFEVAFVGEEGREAPSSGLGPPR